MINILKPKKRAKKDPVISDLMKDVENANERDIVQTPLLAIIVTISLDRLNFVSFIKSVVTWDEKQ
ncbi:MAG: hypothetical protein STSR0009_13440 [Methanoregula sp.]